MKRLNYRSLGPFRPLPDPETSKDDGTREDMSMLDFNRRPLLPMEQCLSERPDKLIDAKTGATLKACLTCRYDEGYLILAKSQTSHWGINIRTMHNNAHK